MMIDFDLLKIIITQYNTFLLSTHVNPDADAIGSEIAFYRILKKLNKKVFILNHSHTPYFLEFLDEENIIQKYDAEKHKKCFEEADVLVALDLNHSDRLASMKNSFLQSEKLKIVIDHHMDPENYADHQFIDTDYCATGHILYDFLKKTKIVPLSFEIANPLYAAIMTDTGSFRFERTNAELHKNVAELLEFGVNPQEVYDKIYEQGKLSRIRLLGHALQSLQITANGKLAYMVLDRKSFESTGADEADTDGFINFCMSVENVVMGMIFIELKNGFKVSFRSKGNIAVNKFASTYGGGGHINAAGARFFDASLHNHKTKIIENAENFLEQNNG